MTLLALYGLGALATGAWMGARRMSAGAVVWGVLLWPLVWLLAGVAHLIALGDQ